MRYFGFSCLVADIFTAAILPVKEFLQTKKAIGTLRRPEFAVFHVAGLFPVSAFIAARRRRCPRSSYSEKEDRNLSLPESSSPSCVIESLPPSKSFSSSRVIDHPEKKNALTRRQSQRPRAAVAHLERWQRKNRCELSFYIAMRVICDGAKRRNGSLSRERRAPFVVSRLPASSSVRLNDDICPISDATFARTTVAASFARF